MLYGYCDDAIKIKMQLKPVMTLKSNIQNIQNIKVGETVSYNATWTAQENSRVGVIPMGYADGIHRLVSNRGHVFVQDQMVPIVGKVCMDFFMIDLTKHKKMVSQGSEVIIFGEKSVTQIQDAADFAKSAETISYEALTSISSRVPRLYTGENS
jgi:alanine racemase